ncbi:MAG: DUF2007 domain-containing protein [Granulosicoccus sp.]
MSIVYRAANLIEAQLIVDELKAGGMHSHITGSYLSGAIGELPPTEVIGVWLYDDKHRERALELIGEFEASRKAVRADWFCRSCQEAVGSEFGACWQCGAIKRSP